MNPLQQALDQAMRFEQTGQLQQAEAVYRQILAAHPDHPDALHQLGLLAARVGRDDVAVDLIQHAIQSNPNLAEYFCNLGNVLQRMNRTNEGIAAMRQAIALQPQFPEALANLGPLLQETGHFDEAIAVLRQAVVLNDGIPITWYNLGNALRATNQCEPAIEAYRRAIALKPDFALAHYNLGLTLLLLGDYAQGWHEFAHRFDAPELSLTRQRFAQPQWDGIADLKDKRILLITEQGFGDVIQFARYIPLLKEREARVVLFCQPEMQRLMQSVTGIEQAMTFGQPAPPFDFYSPLLDLGKCFATTPQTIPAPIPYLHVDPQRAEFWKSRLSQTPGRLKIGLAWAGRPQHRNDRNRSIPLKEFLPLLSGNAAIAQFVSLQKGPLASQLHESANDIADWSEELSDFADTAALIANLDLVISADTAVAHLAGAMGKPTGVLLPFAPDWRWMLGRTDSPWYPTMRLFRQTKLNDWQSPIQEVVHALREFKIRDA